MGGFGSGFQGRAKPATTTRQRLTVKDLGRLAPGTVVSVLGTTRGTMGKPSGNSQRRRLVVVLSTAGKWWGMARHAEMGSNRTHPLPFWGEPALVRMPGLWMALWLSVSTQQGLCLLEMQQLELPQHKGKRLRQAMS